MTETTKPMSQATAGWLIVLLTTAFVFGVLGALVLNERIQQEAKQECMHSLVRPSQDPMTVEYDEAWHKYSESVHMCMEQR